MKADTLPAERMMALFAGSERAHGTHGEPVSKGLKAEITTTAKTVPWPATLALWEQHIAGKKPLGIIPIRADGTCAWGSIDIDRYDINRLQLVEVLERIKLPLVPCVSKSGGMHLFLFLAEPAPAGEVQAALRDAAEKVGMEGCEIFPKQTNLDAGGVGNWMVMPYFGSTYGGKLKNQHGLKKTGAEMTIGEFVKFADGKRTTLDKFVKQIGKRKTPPSTADPDMPPCLERLAKEGVSSTRNNALLHYGIFAKLKFGEGWKQEVRNYNNAVMRPPLDSSEVEVTIKSLAKRDYGYTCKNEPMLSVCDRAACLLRRFGVSAAPGVHIDEMEISGTEPKEYHVKIDGMEMAVTMRELNNFRFFNGECIEQLGRSFVPPKEAEWNVMVGEALKKAKPREVPPEAEAGAEFREYLNAFCNNSARANRIEDLPRGRPWYDDDTGRHYFRIEAFQKYLKTQDPRGSDTRRRIIKRLTKLGGGPHSFTPTGGKTFRCWFVPEKMLEGAPTVYEPPKPPESDI